MTRPPRALLPLLALGLSCASCASVTVGQPRPAEAVAAERPRPREHAVLADAARDLEARLPPAPARGEALGLMLRGEGRAARRDAVHAYLSGLRGDEPVGRVMADVEAVLASAEAVAAAGRLAAEATELAEADVALLEGAAATLRRGRTLYAAALTVLADAGAPVKRSEVGRVKDAFRRSANEVGAAADLVAERLAIAGEAPSRLASPAGGAPAGL